MTELPEIAQELRDQSVKLRAEVATLQEQRRIERRTYTVVAGLLVIMLVIAIAGIYDSRQRAIESKERGIQTQTIIRETQETTDLIRDCLDPNGECKKRGDASTARVLEAVIQGFTAVQRCSVVSRGADDPVATYDACVAKLETAQ